MGIFSLSYDYDFLPESASWGRLKELIRLVPSAYVHRRKTGLHHNTGRQVSPLSHLTISDNLLVTGQFLQAGPQIIHVNIHGFGNVAASKFLRRANVQ